MASKIIDPNFPAVTFYYSFDPITMKYEPKKPYYNSLIISICAIIGGVFAVS